MQLQTQGQWCVMIEQTGVQYFKMADMNLISVSESYGSKMCTYVV